MSEVGQVLEQTQPRFVEIAPSNLKFEAEKGFAIQVLKNNDYLMKAAMGCPSSLQQALTNVAAIGLSLNPAEKLAYLIPRNVSVTVNGQKRYETRVFLEPSYMGLIRLATDSGSIQWAQAYPVYSNDTFVFNGAGVKAEHKFNPFDSIEKRGDFIGVYCTAKTNEGDYLVHTMSAADVLSIRDRSESWKKNQSGPWKTDFIEQAKKTVIRQAFKTWPRTNVHRLAVAVDLSNENEGFEAITTSPPLSEYTAQMKEYFDSLITKQDALGMHVLQQSLGDEKQTVFINLYHSFEKGQKGKYQKIVDGLIDKGRSIMSDLRLGIIDATERQDETSIIELVSDLDADAIQVLKDGLGAEHSSYIEECLKNNQ